MSCGGNCLRRGGGDVLTALVCAAVTVAGKRINDIDVHEEIHYRGSSRPSAPPAYTLRDGVSNSAPCVLCLASGGGAALHVHCGRWKAQDWKITTDRIAALEKRQDRPESRGGSRLLFARSCRFSSPAVRPVILAAVRHSHPRLSMSFHPTQVGVPQ